MSTHTVCLNCPACDEEFEVEVECTSAGCRESYDAWTGWAPAEGPEFDIVGPETCESCEADLCTKKLEERAIDSALNAIADEEFHRPRRRRR